MSPKPRDRRRELLLAELDEAYERKAWHGPNLRGSLRGVTPEQAAWRPAPGRHNIRELALHAAYWKYTVRRRLIGGKRGSFAFPGSNWFTRPVPGEAVEKGWREEIAILDRSHRELRRAVEELAEADLDRRTRGSRQINSSVIAGVAAHDVYHAGQIQLVKALWKAGRARGRTQ
jgi:hypothetical protein